jgi:hypothetical protein
MIVFKRLRLGDCEDPQLYAAGPIIDWQNSDEGKWVMENAKQTPSWRIVTDPETYSYRVDIYGELDEPNEIIFRLKYGFPSIHQ